MDYSNVLYSISPMGKTVTMVDADGIRFEAELSTLHIKEYAVLTGMSESVANSIAPGSMAYVTGMGEVYQKGFDGNWEAVS